jgi:hypothetical protein
MAWVSSKVRSEIGERAKEAKRKKSKSREESKRVTRKFDSTALSHW